MTRPVGARLSRSAVVAAVLGAAGGTSAYAQIDFDMRTRLVLGWGDDAVPLREPMTIDHPGTYNIELQEGVYESMGFTNFGVANWIGRIRSSEPGLSQPEHPRPAPFDSSIGRDGVVSSDQTLIGEGTGYVDATVGPLAYSYMEPPAPPPPEPYGADEFVPLYRFSLTVTDLTPREITLTAESLTLAYTPISEWHVVTNILPDPEIGEPGYIEYVPIVLPSQWGEHVSAATAVLHVIPAPVAGVGMALGAMLLQARRRQRR